MWSGDTFLQLDYFCILFLGYLHWGPSTDIVSVIEFKNLLLYFLCKSFVFKIFAFLTDNFTLPTNSFTTARFCVEILVGVYLMCWLLFLKLFWLGSCQSLTIWCLGTLSAALSSFHLAVSFVLLSIFSNPLIFPCFFVYYFCFFK